MTNTLMEAPSTVEYMKRLLASAPEDVLKIVTGTPVQEERKYVTVRIPEDMKFSTLEIYHLTDVQWGHVCCQEDRFVEYRDFILAAPNRFALFGGDMIDAATLLSTGTPWENTGPPIEQIYRFCEVAMPIRHRVLGYVGGNHERHTRSVLGGDAGSIIATYLGIPYSAGQQFIDIHYGEWKPHKTTLWHGRGTSRTPGAKMSMMVDFARDDTSDLVLVGHLHDCMNRWAVRKERNVRGKSIGAKKYCVAMSSSFLEFFGSYGEIMGLPPSDVFMTKATLFPDGRWEVTQR